MTFSWQYPIYVLPLEDGFVSLVDKADPQNHQQMLVVMTDPLAAAQLMDQYGVPGDPVPIPGTREFRWMLERIRAPISEVVFDPQPTDHEVHPAWRIAIKELIDRHLIVLDYSPWSYPIYVIAMAAGFASVHGQTPDGEPLTAIGVFTSKEKADAYLESVSEQGTPCELANVEDAIVFFKGIVSAIPAVAVDPVVVDGQWTVKLGFAIEKLFSARSDTDEEVSGDV